MFTVVRRASQPKSGLRAPTLSDWDPVQLMQRLLREESHREAAPTRPSSERTFAPRFDVKETKEAFLFHADLPGVRDEDIDISITGNRLVITGRRAAEAKKEGDNFHLIERGYGEFSRSFTLPDTADTEKLTASTAQGVLSLTLPKRVESQPRRVSINANANANQGPATASVSGQPKPQA